LSYIFNWKMPKLHQVIDTNGQPIGQSVESWGARPEPPQQSMAGKYCKLEPFDLERHHAGLYKSFATDKDNRNWTYLPYGPFDSVNQFRSWCQSGCLGNDPQFHTIINSIDQLVGMASYLRITPEVGCIEVGNIHFSPLMQRTRMATESMYLMMRRVFDELGYRRYEWKCNALNEPSCRAAERFGFEFEGIFRQATISKSRNRDTAWFAIIDTDWPRLKMGYERWLDEANFDRQGQQIRSLQACIESC